MDFPGAFYLNDQMDKKRTKSAKNKAEKELVYKHQKEKQEGI